VVNSTLVIQMSKQEQRQYGAQHSCR